MRKGRALARAVSVLVALTLGVAEPARAVIAVRAVETASRPTPVVLPQAAPVRVDARTFSAATSASALGGTPAVFRPAPAAPVVRTLEAPAPLVSAAPVARALNSVAAGAAALGAPETPADDAKSGAGRPFDATAPRPADGGETLGSFGSGTAPVSRFTGSAPAFKPAPPRPVTARRLAAKARASAPRWLLAAGAGVVAWALAHFGALDASIGAPLALLAGTLGGPAWTPSDAQVAEFMARVAAIAPYGTPAVTSDIDRTLVAMGLGEEHFDGMIGRLMVDGELGVRDNKTMMFHGFGALVRAAGGTANSETAADAAALEAVRLLNSGAPLDHAKGLASAAKALELYARHEKETGRLPAPVPEARVLRANLALEHIGDLLRAHKAGVVARRAANDPFRVKRVAEIDAALSWLSGATFSIGRVPALPPALQASLLAILSDLTPRDESGLHTDALTTAYVDAFDLIERWSPDDLVVGAAPAGDALSPDANGLGLLLVKEVMPAERVRDEHRLLAMKKFGWDDARVKAALTELARRGYIVIRDNGVMLMTSLPFRAGATPAGDEMQSAHADALAGAKLLNSTNPLDHLRAVARLDSARVRYASLQKAGRTDGAYQEAHILFANAVLESAADALRAHEAALRRAISGEGPVPQGLDRAGLGARRARVRKALEWLEQAYYSADERRDMSKEVAVELQELLDLRTFGGMLKDKIHGDLEIVRGTRLVRQFLAHNADMHGRVLSAETGDAEPGDANGFRALRSYEYKTLLDYGVDVTQKAVDGKLKPMIGRKAELRQMVKTLLRVEKNNPLVIGEKGVGKTAIVNGLAQAIALGQIPELRGKNLVKIDLNKVVAGTTLRGQFEERMQKIIDEAKKSNGRIILFIDEIHMIVGAGDSDKATDAAQILKESLADGSLSLIGATTMDEFRRIEKDGALMRRFNPVKLLPPTKDEAEAIVDGVKPVYEKKHGVTILIETVKAAVSLAARYVTDRHLPDSALDLMDDASAEVELKASEAEAAGAANPTRAVTPEDIAREISMRTGIPAGKLNEDKKAVLRRLPEDMKSQVIGQDEAVEKVAEAVQQGETGYRDPKQPIASFVFLGPTGVGKTELARALAKIKFGSEKNMLRLDMSEYQEKHSVSRLISAPPGYVGHEDGGQLTESIRRNPYQVILLDEIEKAHPDVFDVLLQVLEDGRLTDGQGRTVDFSNTIIIMTSNIGGSLAGEKEEPKRRPIGFGAPEPKAEPAAAGEDARKAKYRDEFKKKYRPEFVNRVGEDRVIVFNELTEKAQLGRILDLRLKALESQLRDKRITVAVTAAARDAILDKALAQTRYGARPIKQLVDRELNRALMDAELEGRLSDGDRALVDWDAAAGRFVAARAP